jgi:hypothetical protein
VIEQAEGGLRMQMVATPAMKGRLEHFQYDTFLVKWDDTTLPDAYCQFRVNREGKVAGLKMEAVSDLADFSFDFHDLDFQALPRKN